MIISRPVTQEYKEGWNRIFGPDREIVATNHKKGHDYYPIRPIPYTPVSRPGTPEYRFGYDLIFPRRR